jgi:hypothetical protein
MRDVILRFEAKTLQIQKLSYKILCIGKRTLKVQDRGKGWIL